jgi:hypothetical protein
MCETGELLVGWREGPRMAGIDGGGPRQERLLRVDRFSGPRLAEGGLGTGGQGSDVNPRLVAAGAD